MAITKELIDGLIVTIQNLYLADDIPWMVGYSGGKDSTAAVQLVWMALEKLPKKDAYYFLATLYQKIFWQNLAKMVKIID